MAMVMNDSHEHNADELVSIIRFHRQKLKSLDEQAAVLIGLKDTHTKAIAMATLALNNLVNEI